MSQGDFGEHEQEREQERGGRGFAGGGRGGGFRGSASSAGRFRRPGASAQWRGGLPPRRRRPGWPRPRPWIFGPWPVAPAVDVGYPEPGPPEPAAEPVTAPPLEPEPSPGTTADAPDSAAEELIAELARRGPVTASLQWTATPQKITSFPLNPLGKGGGIYIVESQGKPIYVGETHNFAARWHSRLQSMFQIGVINRGPLPASIHVWFGEIIRLVPNKQSSRKAVEHAVIRTLSEGGLGGSLRNVTSVREFHVVDDITVTSLLPGTYAASLVRPVRQFSGNVLRALKGTKYELPGRALLSPLWPTAP